MWDYLDGLSFGHKEANPFHADWDGGLSDIIATRNLRIRPTVNGS